MRGGDSYRQSRLAKRELAIGSAPTDRKLGVPRCRAEHGVGRPLLVGVNVRASTVLGVVGAGGIGQELKNSMDLLLFPRLLTIILLILVTVTVIDHTSEWLRRKLE
jgi:hypothetical protein